MERYKYCRPGEKQSEYKPTSYAGWEREELLERHRVDRYGLYMAFMELDGITKIRSVWVDLGENSEAWREGMEITEIELGSASMCPSTAWIDFRSSEPSQITEFIKNWIL